MQTKLLRGGVVPFVLLMGLLLAAVSTEGMAQGPRPIEVVWKPQIDDPSYPNNNGPKVVVDAAHGNWHTIDFRFASFADLLRADGYPVEGSSVPITDESLADAEVFVIANAVLGGEDSVWVLPTPPAVTEDEVAALEAWVREGGSLLLIADHMPFPASVESLARAFGFVFYNGYARAGYDRSGTLVSTHDNGLLTEEFAAVLGGGEAFEPIKSYTGQGFTIPDEAIPLMRLPDDWRLYFPVDAFVPMSEQTANISTAGLYQGALLRYGEGRVAVFGEAAMFTAQALERPDGRQIRVGLNDPEAAGNADFILSVLGWLSE